jgi:23S rRNA (uracil1939-C5)-methyltransferase
MARRKYPQVAVEISGLAFGGKGIARLDGLAVFVPNTVPGDRALVQITRRKKNFAEAYLSELIAPSPDRVAAPCPYSGVCGGCSWQFLRYEKQLDYKRRHVAESLEHIGGIKETPVHATLPSPSVFAYRNKMEFTCADRRWLMPAELRDPDVQKGFAIGLHVPGTFHKVIDTQACLLQPDAGNRILREIRDGIRSSGQPVYGLRSHEGFWRFAVLRSSTASGRWLVNLVTAFEDAGAVSVLARRLRAAIPEIAAVVNNVSARKAAIAVGEFERHVEGDSSLRDRIGRFEFEISANSFFQTNTRSAEGLYDVVAAYAGLDGAETVLDLYSGTGTIPIMLSGRCREVIGIEMAASAVADARSNCRLNGIENCRFLLGDIQDRLPGLEVRPEVVVVDPPRIGMAGEVVREVLKLGPERIVYVSCNPATLARDLALLEPDYQTMEIQAIDMFPHTFHVESVARLERRHPRRRL